MPERYVYILGDHDEGGTRNVSATLDRARLPAMVSTDCDECDGSPASIAEARAEYAAGLALLLDRSDAALVADDPPHPLGRGWGGLQLIVARLV